MPTVIARDAALPERLLNLPNGGQYRKRAYLGGFAKPAHADAQQPQVYTVGQLPRTVVEPHFHVVEQWQVFVAGHGTFGRHRVLPGAIHYADRYIGYGPIVASDEGVTYLTLRAMSDPGAQFLDHPDARTRLKAARQKAGRHHYVPAERVASERVPIDAGCVECDAVIEPAPDGLATWVVRLGPRAEYATPTAAGSGGQLLLTLTGDVDHQGKVLPPLSCAHVRCDEPPLRLTTGEAGALLLVMQSPRVAG